MIAARPQVGDVLCITLTARGESKTYKKPYQVYSVVNLSRPAEPINWDNLLGFPQTLSPQAVLAMPPAEPAQLPEGGDDIPF